MQVGTTRDPPQPDVQRGVQQHTEQTDTKGIAVVGIGVEHVASQCPGRNQVDKSGGNGGQHGSSLAQPVRYSITAIAIGCREIGSALYFAALFLVQVSCSSRSPNAFPAPCSVCAVAAASAKKISAKACARCVWPCSKPMSPCRWCRR